MQNLFLKLANVLNTKNKIARTSRAILGIKFFVRLVSNKKS